MNLPSEMTVLFDREQFLLAVEATVHIIKQNSESENDAAAWLLAEVPMLCYSQGVLAVGKSRSENEEVYQNKSESEVWYEVIEESQRRWDLAKDYCKDVLDIEFHPLGLMIFLKGVSEQNVVLIEPIEAFMGHLEKEAEKEMKPSKIVPVPEIAKFGGDKKELAVAYFDMLSKLGTFYNDRDRYETEEQKKLHDKIVAIFYKLTEDSPVSIQS